jgi:CDP-paratose 2-epimerase
MKKYLVTGGLGVIGSRFVELLLERGDSAIIIDAAEERRNIWMKTRLSSIPGSLGFLEIVCSRIEKYDLIPLLHQCDAVLHAAAHTGIPHSAEDPSDDWVSNVDVTRHILESMRKYDIRIPTVMLSSVKPYKVDNIPNIECDNRTIWPGKEGEPNLSDIGIDENHLLEPDEPYAASKMAQSALVMAYARTYNLPVTVLRCSNLYGDAPCHGPRHGWLTWFCISAAMNWSIEIQGTGKQTRDMLFSNDVASAVLASFDNMDKMSGNVYNIGGGPHNQISCLEALNALMKITGTMAQVTFGPGRINEDMLFVTNHSKFTGVTQWWPEYGVMAGMERIIKWATDNRDGIKWMYERYI